MLTFNPHRSAAGNFLTSQEATYDGNHKAHRHHDQVELPAACVDDLAAEHRALMLNPKTLTSERGRAVHQSPSDVLLADPSLLDCWLGVAAH
jgi:hypothetical protein